MYVAYPEIHRSDQEHYDMATPPSPKWSKRPILQPASPKPLTLRHSTPKPLPLYHSQPVSNLRAHGAPHSPRSGHTQSFSQSSSLGRRSSSPGDVRSKGMSLFRRQQEKLAQLGADVQGRRLHSLHVHARLRLLMQYQDKSDPHTQTLALFNF